MAAGGIIIAAIMLLIFPVLVMFVGALWTVLFGWVTVEDAERRAGVEVESPAGAE